MRFEVKKQKRHPSLIEGWTPLSFQGENSHAVVKILSICETFIFIPLLAKLNYVVNQLF